jgi:hypothetical protein
VACDEGSDPFPVETVPLAAIRFINAVPDTMGFDYRFVDFLTNAGFFDATFRANLQLYQSIEAGSHTFRVFLSSTVDTITSDLWNETTFDFAGSSYYGHPFGYMRSGSTPAAAKPSSRTILRRRPPDDRAAGSTWLADLGSTCSSGRPPPPRRRRQRHMDERRVRHLHAYVELDTAGCG